MISEKDFQPPVDPTNTESKEDKKEEIIESTEEDVMPNQEVDSQEEKENKGTEEERKVKLSERFNAIQDIMDYKRIKEGMMSEREKKYFSGAHNSVDVFSKLEDYIRDCLEKNAPADEIEKNVDILEYSAGELLKDNPNREESDRRLAQFIKDRIDHFVATFNQRIEVIEKSGICDLQEEAIKIAKEKIDLLLKDAEEIIKQGVEDRAEGKKLNTGDAKLLMKVANEMEHAIPGVEASHEAALLFRADDFKEEKPEEKPEKE